MLIHFDEKNTSDGLGKNHQLYLDLNDLKLVTIFFQIFLSPSLSIQVCPKKGINPTILLWG